MSQDVEKYLYFNVGLLKNSFALDALWQDAMKYHLVDQPGKLIALRLTEYYEMIGRGILHPGASVSIAATPTATGASSSGINGVSLLTDQADDNHPDEGNLVAASPDAEQNADEAAEYWARL
jgi:hypothetical protein